MPVDHHNHFLAEAGPPAPSRKNRMGFNAKIVLVVFCIMALSQTMGALFSALSLEEVYLAAMTSKYEILGKDLKRRIEQSLKFGKRLERFVGIEKLTDPILRQTNDIDEIFLSDRNGRLLHTSKASSLSETDSDLPMDPARLQFLMEQAKDEPTSSRLHFTGGSYYLLFPLTAPYGGQGGILGLTFSRTALDRKKNLLMKQTFLHLTVSIFITAAALFLMIEYGFSRPLNRWVGEQIQSGEDEGAFTTELVSGPIELRNLYQQMSAYIKQTRTARNDLVAALGEIETTAHGSTHADQAVLRMKRILEGKADDAD